MQIYTLIGLNFVDNAGGGNGVASSGGAVVIIGVA